MVRVGLYVDSGCYKESPQILGYFNRTLRDTRHLSFPLRPLYQEGKHVLLLEDARWFSGAKSEGEKWWISINIVVVGT